MLLPWAQTHEHVHKVLLFPHSLAKTQEHVYKALLLPVPQSLLWGTFPTFCTWVLSTFSELQEEKNIASRYTKMPFNYRVHSSMYWYLPDLPKHVLILLYLVNFLTYFKAILSVFIPISHRSGNDFNSCKKKLDIMGIKRFCKRKWLFQVDRPKWLVHVWHYMLCCPI